jgi:Leucine-rich repeat (LRR) protein
VVSFRCDHCGLSGELPGAIEAWTAMVSFDVGKNRVAGALPYVYKQLTGSVPCGIGQWRNLTHLDVSNGGLTSLPDCFANLTGLKRVWVVDNEISSLPVSLLALTTLESLDVAGNSISQDLDLTGMTALAHIGACVVCEGDGRLYVA